MGPAAWMVRGTFRAPRMHTHRRGAGAAGGGPSTGPQAGVTRRPAGVQGAALVGGEFEVPLRRPEGDAGAEPRRPRPGHWGRGPASEAVRWVIHSRGRLRWGRGASTPALDGPEEKEELTPQRRADGGGTV